MDVLVLAENELNVALMRDKAIDMRMTRSQNSRVGMAQDVLDS